jgi:hypothetical protein
MKTESLSKRMKIPRMKKLPEICRVGVVVGEVRGQAEVKV